MNTDIAPKKVHQGRNIKRLREMLGIKQESLATELNITQAGVSKLESKEEIEEETLKKVAEFLKLPVDAIKNFNDEGALNFVANTFHDSAVGNNYYPTFNPIDKIIELYTEKEALYERMLKEKDELLAKFIK
ncbi:helix-turn-helix domain-containing protein [uncultured Apibacter sp.]|uniref:helix-turn-helix domain-containing protein n=1 Tax=uncultured Apibacter sp. TaxID=1778616 RepID=UPI0025F9F9FD|nr:helix-turn-helix transcriptional regulator [uncultured Apibacter sp.]